MPELDEILNQSKNLLKSKKFKEAISLLEEAYEAENTSQKLKEALITVLFEFGIHLNDEFVAGFDEAILIFNRIIELEPNNYRAYYNLGITFQNLNLVENALKAYQTAIKINPDYYFCFYNIGLIYEEKQDFIKAVEYHKKALKIEPNFRYAQQAIGELRDITEKGLEPVDCDQFRSLMLMSNKVRIDMIQEVLKISRTELIDLMISWGKNYDFKLDGDYLIINKNKLDEFFNDLKYRGSC
ncbi:MAG: tetratricopeptide repeat protein [Promethearchaeota archaeon]|nr:MAG: tetratricopeptide repeat protein [Candidatus Lokiarchaeota archaeon]